MSEAIRLTDYDRLAVARAGQLPSGIAAIREYAGEHDTVLALGTAYAEAREIARDLAAIIRRAAGDAAQITEGGHG